MSVLPRKFVRKSVSSKRLSRASVSTSSVESNVNFSVSCTSACLGQNPPIFNIQDYCNLFFSGSFSIAIPFQNVLTQIIFFIFLLSLLMFFMYYKFNVIKMNVFINLFLAIVIMLTKLTRLRKFFILHISRNGTFFTFHHKNIYHFSIIQDNFCCFCC